MHTMTEAQVRVPTRGVRGWLGGLRRPGAAGAGGATGAGGFAGQGGERLREVLSRGPKDFMHGPRQQIGE